MALRDGERFTRQVRHRHRPLTITSASKPGASAGLLAGLSSRARCWTSASAGHRAARRPRSRRWNRGCGCRKAGAARRDGRDQALKSKTRATGS
jgi:hypothetical protein